MRVCTGFHHSCKSRPISNQATEQMELVILPIKERRDFLHDRLSSDIWLRCRKKLMTNITFQNGRKARNTWLAGKIKCGKCGYALKTTHNPSGYEYLRCSKRADHKGCPGCGTLRKNEFEQFIFTAMGEKFREFKLLRGGEGKVNPKITAYQVELAQVEAEIEKLLDTLTGANATLLAYANKKSRIWTTAAKHCPRRLQTCPLKRCPPSRLNYCPGIWAIGSISALRTNEKPLTA